MGQNLKGKECGKGICQRKDGKYPARFTGMNGKRCEKHFNTLPEARNRLADAQPKALQKLLGHASIKTTMERYVHVTNDSLTSAVRQFETLNIVA